MENNFNLKSRDEKILYFYDRVGKILIAEGIPSQYHDDLKQIASEIIIKYVDTVKPSPFYEYLLMRKITVSFVNYFDQEFGPYIDYKKDNKENKTLDEVLDSYFNLNFDIKEKEASTTNDEVINEVIDNEIVEAYNDFVDNQKKPLYKEVLEESNPLEEKENANMASIARKHNLTRSWLTKLKKVLYVRMLNGRVGSLIDFSNVDEDKIDTLEKAGDGFIRKYKKRD